MTESEMNHNKYTAGLMNQAVFMLAQAGDDVRLGRYSLEERRKLASGLEKLVQALRGENQNGQPVIIDQREPDELRHRTGFIEWGSIS